MSISSSNYPHSDLDHWLVSLGFTRGNPFAFVEADQERSVLPDYFVEVDSYDLIKGERSVIVFAPRGGGKSALRVMLASYSAPLVPSAGVLVAEFTDFNLLIAKRRRNELLTIDDYVTELLQVGLRALFTSIFGYPTTKPRNEESTSVMEQRSLRAKTVRPSTRSRLASLIHHYLPSILSNENLYDLLHWLDPTFSPGWKLFTDSTSTQTLRSLVKTPSLASDPLANLLIDLNDFDLRSAYNEEAPTERISTLVNIARDIGFQAIHFLLDRLDEHQDTANDPAFQADVLQPLLGDLPILELPHLAFKIFLWNETRDILLMRSAIRRDRLADQAVTVEWSRHKLKQLLDQRVFFFSNAQYEDFTQLCQKETRVDLGYGRSARLAEWIEDELLQLAQGSPRRLLIAAQLLCQTHVRRAGPIGTFERQDWEDSKTELLKKMPPILKLNKQRKNVYVGDRQLSLSTKEHQILLTLAQHGGACEREELVNAVWGGRSGVTDWAIDQAIRRLRRKLGDDSEEPIYLKTAKGYGYELAHCQLD